MEAASPSECWKQSTKMNGITSQKAVMFMVSPVRTSRYTDEVQVSVRTRGSTSASLDLYSKGARFESRQDYWKSLHFWFYSVPPGKFPDITRFRARSLPSKSLPINHSSYLLYAV
jgi:hypothetical protein